MIFIQGLNSNCKKSIGEYLHFMKMLNKNFRQMILVDGLFKKAKNRATVISGKTEIFNMF